MVLFTKLLLAHLLGDFIFQSERWVRDKKRKKLRSKYLYLHFLIHGLLVFILVQSWLITGLIAGSHAAIDITKQLMQTSDNRRAWFFGDQLLHLAVIVAVVGWLNGVQAELLITVLSDYLLEVTAIVFLTIPSSVVIQMIISRWDPDPKNNSPDSLDRAGKYIGILERLFVFTFVILGQWNALGFLIAAKSVFRFGDLKEAHDRKLTEYILIGTLLSVGMASVVAALVRQFS